MKRKDESIEQVARVYNRLRDVVKDMKDKKDVAEKLSGIEADINRLEGSEKETAQVGLEVVKSMQRAHQEKDDEKEIEREARVRPSAGSADSSLLNKKANPNSYTVECPYCNEEIEYVFDPLHQVSEDIIVSPNGNYLIECPNCQNKIQVSPAPLDLAIVKIDKPTKYGFFFEIMDKPTARTCWLSGFINDNRQWEFDFLNYNIDMMTKRGLVENAFQKDLDAYTEEIGNLVYEVSKKNRNELK